MNNFQLTESMFRDTDYFTKQKKRDDVAAYLNAKSLWCWVSVLRQPGLKWVSTTDYFCVGPVTSFVDVTLTVCCYRHASQSAGDPGWLPSVFLRSCLPLPEMVSAYGSFTPCTPPPSSTPQLTPAVLLRNGCGGRAVQYWHIAQFVAVFFIKCLYSQWRLI